MERTNESKEGCSETNMDAQATIAGRRRGQGQRLTGQSSISSVKGPGLDMPGDFSYLVY